MMGCKREGEMGTLALHSDRFLGEIGYMTREYKTRFYFIYKELIRW